MREILPGILIWSWYAHNKGYNFNGHVVEREGKRVLIDPPPATLEEECAIEGRGPYAAVLITNKDHVRQSLMWKERLQAPLWAPALDTPLLDFSVDYSFHPGEALPAGLTAVGVPDNKTPGETALYLAKEKVLILGDALIGRDGGLTLLPPEKYRDPAKAREGVRTLLALDVKAVLVGDGEPVLQDAREALRRATEGT